MLSRKTLFTFLLFIFISTTTFAQSVFGLGAGIGQLNYFYIDKGTATSPSNLKIESKYSPRVFVSWAPFNKKSHFSPELNIDLADWQLIGNKYTEYGGAQGGGTTRFHNYHYNIFFLQVSPFVNYRFELKRSQLNIGAGAFANFNFSTYTDSCYTFSPNTFEIKKGKGYRGPNRLGSGGVAFHASYDIYLNGRFYLSPELLYRLNFWDFYNIRGFHEFYFSIGIKMKMRDRSSTTDQSPPK